MVVEGSIGWMPRRRGWAAGLAALAAIATALATLVGGLVRRDAFDDYPIEIVPIAAVLAIVFAAIYAARRGEPSAGVVRGGSPGTLRVTGDALHVVTADAEWSAPRRHVEGGFVELHDACTQLVLLLKGGRQLTVVVRDRGQAEEVLDELAVAPSRRVLALELGSVVDRRTRAWLGAALALSLPLCMPFFVLVALFGYGVANDARLEDLVTVGAASLFASLPLIGAFGVVRKLARTQVRIGADGIVVRELVRRRFVPLAAIERVRFEDAHVVLDGPRKVRVRVGTEVEGQLVAERLEHLRAREVLRAPTLSPLARAGRSIGEWRESLRVLADDGYRAACSPDELSRIVGNPTSTPELRVAAAVALASRGERSRIRVAIEAIAEPTLRWALERAESGEIDEDALARATRLFAPV